MSIFRHVPGSGNNLYFQTQLEIRRSICAEKWPFFYYPCFFWEPLVPFLKGAARFTVPAKICKAAATPAEERCNPWRDPAGTARRGSLNISDTIAKTLSPAGLGTETGKQEAKIADTSMAAVREWC